MGRRLVLAEQLACFDALFAAPAPAKVLVEKADTPLMVLDPGPKPEGAGKMAGKSARSVGAAKSHWAGQRAAADAARERDVSIAGPHRYYLVTVPGNPDRRQLIDRETGGSIQEGPWLNVWGAALRLNGIELSAVGEWRYFEMMELREAQAHAAAGGVAVHHTGFPFRSYGFTAHLFARDQATLLDAVRQARADPKWIQYPGTDREHYDLMGAPLRAAMQFCGRAGYDPTVERTAGGAA